MSDLLATHRTRFEADPEETAAFEWLEEAHFLAQDWQPLARCYRHRLTAASLQSRPAERAKLQFRLGQLLEERVMDPAGAILAYRECVALAPGMRSAWQSLRGLYAERGSWTAVLQVAELELAQITEPGEQASLLDEMARIWDAELGDEDQASLLRARAGALVPAQAPAAEEPTPDDAPPLVQQAWLAAARGDSTSAVTALREAIERDPGDVDAVDMLVTVLEGAERHSETAQLLERRAALAADGETRAAVLARLGVVRETQLGDASGACDAHERALAADPNHTGSRAALLRLYRSAERWSELRSLLEQSAETGPDEARLRQFCDLGELLFEQFDDRDAAIASYQRALALDPNCESARQAMERLRDGTAAGSLEAADVERRAGAATSENRSVRIVGVLERKLARLQEEGNDFDGAAIKLRLRIAEIRSSTLGDLDGAIELLAPCIHAPDSILEVAQPLGIFYERAGRHEELIDMARRAADCSVDPDERAGWFRRAAETARGIGNSEIAVAFYQCLLGERPSDRNAEAALLELHRARGEVGALVVLLRSQLARVDRREELPLQLELAELLEQSLEDPAGALPHWRRALALDTSQVQALERGLNCADLEGGPLRQLDLLEHLIGNAGDEPTRARLLARSGDLMVDRFGWLEEGADQWSRSLELAPDQPGVRSRLEAAQQAAAV